MSNRGRPASGQVRSQLWTGQINALYQSTTSVAPLLALWNCHPGRVAFRPRVEGPAFRAQGRAFYEQQVLRRCIRSPQKQRRKRKGADASLRMTKLKIPYDTIGVVP